MLNEVFVHNSFTHTFLLNFIKWKENENSALLDKFVMGRKTL